MLFGLLAPRTGDTDEGEYIAPIGIDGLYHQSISSSHVMQKVPSHRVSGLGPSWRPKQLPAEGLHERENLLGNAARHS